MNHVNPPFVIISATLATHSPSVALTKTHSLAIELRELGFEPISVDGCYKGAREMAWLVPVSSSVAFMVELEQLTELARQYQQESILYVAFSGAATLIFDIHPTNDKRIGTWCEVFPTTAELICRHTFDHTEIEGRYYVAN